MILYHGSNVKVPYPDILFSRKEVDFGPGFYTTPIRQQAVDWCGKFKRRHYDGIVSRYAFDETALNKAKVLRFDSYSEEWLDFIITCRKGMDASDYDVVIGGVANDKVFNTIELYFDHIIKKSEAITRLQFEEPNLQICFRNQSFIDKYLHYKGSEFV